MARKKINKLRGDTFAISPTPSPARKSVEVKKAKNGFVVSSYHPENGEQLYIAKSHKEAVGYASKCLKI